MSHIRAGVNLDIDGLVCFENLYTHVLYGGNKIAGVFRRSRSRETPALLELGFARLNRAFDFCVFLSLRFQSNTPKCRVWIFTQNTDIPTLPVSKHNEAFDSTCFLTRYPSWHFGRGSGALVSTEKK